MDELLKFVLMAVINEIEVPDEMVEHAVDELKVIGMRFDAGTREAVVLDEILKAVEERDPKRLEKAGELAGIILEGESLREHIEPTQDMRKLVDDAVNSFVGEAELDKDKTARLVVLDQLNDKFSAIPLLYEHGLLFMFDNDNAVILVYLVNDETGMTKFDVVKLVDGMDDKVNEVVTAVNDQWDISHIEFVFLGLDFQAYDGNRLKMRTFELKGEK